MRCVLPAKLNRLIWRLVPSATVTWFGAVSPGVRFRFDASGRGEPVGHAVTKVLAVGSVPVRLKVTADADGGSRPDRSTVRNPPGPSGPPLTRVSSIRTGDIGVNPCVDDVV